MVQRMIRATALAVMTALLILGQAAGGLLRAETMKFEVVERRGLRILAATGEIVPGTSRHFMQAVTAATRGGRTLDAICFNSGGGNVSAGIEMGSMIRRLGLATTLCTFLPGPKECSSSCSFAALGGTIRYFVEGQLGVHQHYTVLEGGETKYSYDDMVSGKQTTATLLKYAAEMGVTVDFMATALSYPPKEMYYLTADDLVAMRIGDPEESKGFQEKMGGPPRPDDNSLRHKADLRTGEISFMEQVRQEREIDRSDPAQLIRRTGAGLGVERLSDGLAFRTQPTGSTGVTLRLYCLATADQVALSLELRSALPLSADKQQELRDTVAALRVFAVHNRGHIQPLDIDGGAESLGFSPAGLGSAITLTALLETDRDALVGLDGLLAHVQLPGIADRSFAMPLGDHAAMLSDAFHHCVTQD